MARPRTTLEMDIDLKSGGSLKLELQANGLIRRQQTPANSQILPEELRNIQSVELQFLALAELIDKLT